MKLSKTKWFLIAFVLITVWGIYSAGKAEKQAQYEKNLEIIRQREAEEKMTPEQLLRLDEQKRL